MRQEILDEVINGEPRYNVIDKSDGTKTIELANDVIEHGTPINRQLFNNLQGDIYTQDRYNALTYNGTNLILNLPLTSYESGKIIKIIAPTTLTNPTININNLGGKTINGTLTNGYKYILIYNGVSFDVIESFPIASQSQATTGADNFSVMTPLRTKEAINSYAMPSNNFSIKTGTISHNSTIPQTAGYKNYVYFVSISEGQATKGQSEQAPMGDTRLSCYVNQSTRKVTALVYAGSASAYDGKVSWASSNATANYIEFAWN